MAEEQKFHEPEAHCLCANNCGFFGSPTTLDLCSKCYKDHCLKEQRDSTAKIAVEKSLSSSIFTEERPYPSALQHDLVNDSVISETKSSASEITEAAPVQVVVAQAQAATTSTNRCGTCRKRVGLTGFKCRCGITCCGSHRYPEEHGCTFDFKAAGKEAIAKANPVVIATKLEKI